LSAPWGDGIKVGLRAERTGDHTLACRYEMTAGADKPVLMLMTALSIAKDFQAGQLVLTLNDGKPWTLPIPWPRESRHNGPGPELVKQITFKLKDAGDVVVGLQPACRVHLESNNLRIAFAADKIAKGTTIVTLTYDFPGKVALLADKDSINRYIIPLVGPGWYPLQTRTAPAPAAGGKPCPIDMSGWLDGPAGKHGGVRMVGDHFEFTDGTRVKFWGVNLSYAQGCAPEKPQAEMTAQRYARFGVNAVRLHKFTEPAGDWGVSDPNDATKYLPAGLDRLDYMCSRLKDHGIYYGFSHTYGFIVQPGNKDRLLAYDEIKRKSNGNTYALINYAEDVQDLLIQRVVNLLKHKNPYAGKTYAEDPALAYLEVHNEDDIFFYSTGPVVDEAGWPKYTRYLKQRFSDWLKAKYDSQQSLAKTWGSALKKGETLVARNVGVQGNPWFFGTNNLSRVSLDERQRMLDNAAFFHDVQNKFYGRFVKAVRDAGYKGPICGSPWQAPTMVPHYYNLRSDYLVGWIDRHNYFGGSLPDSMLKQPGSGYLGTGLQQVVDRPFGISEWIHVYPSLYSAEGPAIFAAYGMGLQGWDVSYEFQSASSRFNYAEAVGSFPWGVWDADLPTQLGQSPTLARMIYRGDVQEGEIISTRRVSPQNLLKGQFDFSDEITQSGDIKSFAGTCPPEALAAGRCVVEFSDKPAASSFPDMSKFREGRVITSTTRQLAWDYSGKGFFTVNTEATKAVVGFAEAKKQALGNVSITVDCPYASIFLTAADKSSTLANAKSAILSAVARNSNKGFSYYAFDSRVIENGKGPVMMEPVKASISIAGRQIAAVNVLDHDGNRTDKIVEVKDGTFSIDGGRDKTFYYEVVFK
jgi:hypothetical protein